MTEFNNGVVGLPVASDTAGNTMTEFDRAEFVEQWCQALEADEFAQGEGYLKTSDPNVGDQYCCLGVACHMLTEANLLDEPVLLSTGATRYGTSIPPFGPNGRDYSTTMLPERAIQLLHIGDGGEFIADKLPEQVRASLPRDEDDDLCTSLVTVNDAGVTFSRIAQLIREIEKAGAWA